MINMLLIAQNIAGQGKAATAASNAWGYYSFGAQDQVDKQKT